MSPARVSVRTEKTLRLVISSLIAAVVGIVAVAVDSEVLGYAAVGIVLAGILVGPLTMRLFTEQPRR